MQEVTIKLHENTAKFIAGIVFAALNPAKDCSSQSYGMMKTFAAMLNHPTFQHDYVNGTTSVRPSDVEKIVNEAKKAGLIEGELDGDQTFDNLDAQRAQ